MRFRFTKGHGTGNDFVIVDESVSLTPELVAAICDRRFGVGGDGVLRVQRRDGGFFMDYWNSDGSLSEMCGNGVRVFARYLWESGLATGSPLEIGTRAGVRKAYLEWDGIRVDMGAPVLLGHSEGGRAISMGNPHLIYQVSSVDDVDLSVAPAFDKEFFPEGVNVSYYEWAGENHVRMRVYERGSGETLSCGTGATAVGVAAILESSGQPTGAITVDVPGGRLTVTVDEQTSWLAGPAVLVFSGEADSVSWTGAKAPNLAPSPRPGVLPRVQR
ncbi:diaminopimelate epimerase [Catelliglobosispora koreensis]|uniref:diaminopimelate epimerase n=1 Tax=Catelliglobosispora koreensis TaxID=129052 RepID=UPI00036F364B|nr:diaminopimelate epimerase [Catelliglobosispora koreensis]